MDLRDLTDEQLNEQLNAVLAEQERRQRLATIPLQVAALREQYVELGGDPDDLAARASFGL